MQHETPFIVSIAIFLTIVIVIEIIDIIEFFKK